MRYLLAVLALVLLSSCIVHRLEVTPVEVSGTTPVVVTSPVKAHLHDGSTVVFPHGIRVSNRVVSGEGRRYDLTLQHDVPVTEVPLDDIAAIESYQTPVSTGATTVASTGATAGVVIGSMAALFLIFGSCPTVYSFDGGDALLESELFSYSITPSFQSRDIDQLGIRSIDNGMLRLELRNEMLETHYIDQLQVLEFVHRPDQKAYPDASGKPLVAGNLVAPTAATDQAGRDVLPDVATADTRAWSTTSERLERVNAEDFLDHLDFDFDAPPGAEQVALVLRLRNSLLNTVLFYDIMLREQSYRALDWMGHDLNHLGNRMQMGLWYRQNMGLTVSQWRNGRYRKIARIGDQGPIAWAERAVRLKPTDDAKIKVRLSFVADNWRFDQVAVAAVDAGGATGRIVPVSRAAGRDGDRPDVATFLASADETYLITQPQDRMELAFDVGDVPTDKDRTFFLESSGYYMEWMRADWLAEEHRKTFEPETDAILRALSIYAAKRDGLREQFEATKLAVR